VVDVRANNDFTLDLKFNDGRVKRFDVRPYLKYKVFKELNDFAYLRR
jgi:hypothetical protein